MKTKLIIIEGIPGSGKTSTAQYVRDWAESKDLKTRLYLEGARCHPASLDNLSFFEEEDYRLFSAQFEKHGEILEKISEKGTDGIFVHYRQWGEVTGEKIPDDLAEILYTHDAHDSLHPDKYRALLVERWQKFEIEAKNTEEVVILECCFLQDPITIFVGKHNIDLEAVRSLIFELAKSVQDLNPSLIVLQGKSVQETLQRVIAERPKEWIELVENYVTKQGYGKAHQLTGLEGIVHFYQMMQDTEGELASHLDWNKLIVDNTDWDWGSVYKR